MLRLLYDKNTLSPLTQGRELKSAAALDNVILVVSPLTQGRELKSAGTGYAAYRAAVAPHAGA